RRWQAYLQDGRRGTRLGETGRALQGRAADVGGRESGFGSQGGVGRATPAVELLLVERLACGARLVVIRHLDETEAFRPPGRAIANDLGGFHGADAGEELLQLGLAGVVRQISYVNSHAQSFELLEAAAGTSGGVQELELTQAEQTRRNQRNPATIACAQARRGRRRYFPCALR